MHERLKLFAGSSHPELARLIAHELGEPLGRSHTHQFSNQNFMVEIQDNVREADVFVLQTACPPLHDHIMELFIMIDALKHASAGRITAVLPYMPYVRSDKKDRPRISITARLMADLLETAGVDRVLLMDLHAPQIQGFFRIPADHLLAAPILCEYLAQNLELDNAVLVAPDAGEAKDILRFTDRLDLPIAIIDKRRKGDDEHAIATHIIGDVAGKTCILIDDEIASGGTMLTSSQILREHGAGRIIAACTHPVFSGKAYERLLSAPIDDIIVTNTLPLDSERACSRITTLNIAALFARAIDSIHHGLSVSRLFDSRSTHKLDIR